MNRTQRLGRMTYAGAVAGLLTLALGASAAIGAGNDGSRAKTQNATARASAMSKRQVQRMISSYVRRHAGRGPQGAPGARGSVGPVGPAGAPGAPGPAGAGVPEVSKLSFKTNRGSAMRPLYSGHGLTLEATCAATSTLNLRSNGNGSSFHFFGVDADTRPFRGYNSNTQDNDTMTLVGGKLPLSGKIEWVGNDGVALTINYMMMLNAPGGECLFSGSVV